MTKETNKPYSSERKMYPEVITWLSQLLRDTHRKSNVEVYDTSGISLSYFIKDKNLESHFSDYLSYDIYVDITGVIRTKSKTLLSFVECKLTPISLRDVSQILGYSLVAKPFYSLILSPAGIGNAVHYLFKVYNRYDILNYDNGKRIRVVKWNPQKKEADLSTLLPPGEHII